MTNFVAFLAHHYSRRKLQICAEVESDKHNGKFLLQFLILINFEFLWSYPSLVREQDHFIEHSVVRKWLNYTGDFKNASLLSFSLYV